jgi:hypothetical protein
MSTYIITLTTPVEGSKHSLLAWKLEYRNHVIVASKTIDKTVQSSINLLQFCHFKRVWWRRHPSNKLIIWTTLLRVIRKQHNARIKHFIAIDPLVEVASVNE